MASVQAFTEAAAAEPASTGIQVGFYRSRRRCGRARGPGGRRTAPANNRDGARGGRVADIVDVLADKTDFSKAQYEKVLANPDGLGLPAYANGNAEGYLIPSTYDLGPKETPESILRGTVALAAGGRRRRPRRGRAEELGYTPAELMIVASLVEAEAARDEDRGKVFRHRRTDSRATRPTACSRSTRR